MREPEFRTDRVVLAKSAADWPDAFQAERLKVAETLGIPVQSIEHFGSTSIPGLVAKPIIDMMSPVRTLDDPLRDRLLETELGYHRPETDFARRVLFRRDGDAGRPGFHLHLVLDPDWPLKKELLFRDWLRDHPEAVERYADLKRSLASEHGDDVARYTAGKTAFIQGIVTEARAARGLPPETDWSE